MKMYRYNGGMQSKNPMKEFFCQVNNQKPAA